MVRWGRTADVAAVLREAPHMVAERDAATGNTALHVASQNDRPQYLATFLGRFRRFADVNTRNAKGNTPLHMAVEYGLRACKEVLLRHGASTEVANADGHPAIRGVSGGLGQSSLELSRETKQELLRRTSAAALAGRRASFAAPGEPDGDFDLEAAAPSTPKLADLETLASSFDLRRTFDNGSGGEGAVGVTL